MEMILPDIHGEFMAATTVYRRRNHYLTVFDCDCKNSREFNGQFLLRALKVSEPCVSLVGGMTKLTSALMRCDKLSKLKESKTRALFLHEFPFFKRITRVCRFDGFL